ncbi:MAG: hypothetical protein C4324_10855 [Blastocatellia bacterium]
MSLEPFFDEEKDPPPIDIEEYLEKERRSIRRKSYWAIGLGGLVVAAHIGWLIIFALAGAGPDFSILFRSLFFVLGLFFLCAGIYGIYHSKTLTAEDIVPSPEAIEFARRSAGTRAIYTTVLVVAIVSVYIVEVVVGIGNAVESVGLVKSRVIYDGEYWRILTGATLHGGLLHIYFNTQALFGFGGLMEYLSNRAHLAIVFLLAIISGGIFSVIFLPDTPSVGASGGIMGLVGYLAVYGYRRRRQVPPDFLKSMLINIGFIAAFGLIAYQFVDNFAHLGGFLAGVFYGILQIPRKLSCDPRSVRALSNLFGVIAMAVFIAESIFSIFRLLGRV